jgi:hypothetical protein
MSNAIIPPVVPAPPGTIPVQPQIPEIFTAGTTIVAPFVSPNNTADVVYRAIADIEISQLEVNTQAILNLQNLQERYYRDGTDFYAAVYGSQLQYTSAIYGADRQLEAEVLRLTTVPAGALTLQQNELNNRLAIAEMQQASINAGIISNTENTIQANNLRFEADTYAADQSLNAAKASATADLAGRNYTADRTKEASVYGSDQDLSGRKYAADQGLTGTKYDADQQLTGTKYASDAETTRLVDKLVYADQKFNLVYPFVQQSIQNAQNQTSPPTPGLSFSPPAISTRGVYSAGQVQKQVNQAVARNDARTNSQILQTQRDLAGRGFSSNSPLLEAVRVGLTGQNLRANNDAETQIRLSASQANADQILKAQELVNAQFNQQQEVALESEKNQITRQVGLVDALAQMIAGIT